MQRPIETILADIRKTPQRSTTYHVPSQSNDVIRANAKAREASMDTLMRELGAAICEGSNIQRDGMRRIALWIRRNLKYVQECHGIEKLQGPYTTLQTGIMDCDDGAILWATLCRAVGLPAVCVGIGHNANGLEHMMGMNSETGRLYELASNEGYQGKQSGGPDDPLVPDGRFWMETSFDGQTVSGWSGNLSRQGNTIPMSVPLVAGFAFALIGSRDGDTAADVAKRFGVGIAVGLIGGVLISTQTREATHGA